MGNSKNAWQSYGLFMMGLGAVTRIYLMGTIGVAELVAFVVAPLIFVKDYRQLRAEGFMPFILMICLVAASMFLSSFANHTSIPFVLKSFATIYSIFAHLVVFHHLLRNNYNALGWYLLGAAFSAIIAIFCLNPTASVTEQGMEYVDDLDVHEVITGPLFWATKVVPLVILPVSALYLKTPIVYSIVAPVIAAIMMTTTSVSGRSASLSILLAGMMIIIGRKSRRTMASIGRHFFLLCGALLLFAVAGKFLYKYAALSNLLGEEQRHKYELQTRSGDSILRLLMRGRKEFFAAIPAALDKPILGHGPFAQDNNRYWERFFSKYGEYEDLQIYYSQVINNGGVAKIPTHSYLMGFWVHYGIGGLIFWIYVVIVIVGHIKKYAASVPQWYGYLAISLANFGWALFFSPFVGRGGFALMMCCILFARAIGRGRLQLPYSMEMEARKYD